MQAGADIRAAIVDLDGTMLHTVPDFELALNGMRAELGLAPVDAATIEPMVGKGSERLIRDVLALDYDATRIDAVFDDAMASYQRHYLAINGERSTLYPEVIEGLRALKDLGLRLACVTNQPIAFATPLLARFGLAPFFEIVYGGDSLARKKPDPLPLQQVCRDFGLRPAQAVAIARSGARRRLFRAEGPLRLQPRPICANNQFRWYSGFAARRGQADRRLHWNPA